MKVGVLILEKYKDRAYPRRTKKKRTSFDYDPNIGLKIILDVLEREAGISEVGYCSLVDINDYDVILISLISINDVLNLVYTFAKRGATAQDMKPTIIIGGPTVDNVKTYEDYGDVFVFGRGEKTILEIWKELEAGHTKTDIPESEFYHVRGKQFESKTMRQATEFYPHPIGEYQERMSGCPNKCFFCHYSFTRSYIKTGKYQDADIYSATCEEVTFDNLQLADSKQRIAGIDGWSERLRLAANKKITNEDIYKKFVDADGIYTDKWITVKLYMISGYPTETPADHEEFRQIILRLKSDVKESRYYFPIHNTPLRLQALTPLGWEAVDFTDYRDYFQRCKSRFEISTDHLIIRLSFAMSSPITVIQTMVITRGEREDGDLLRFHGPE